MSKLMVLQVKHLQTSGYHPQTNGLKRLNQNTQMDAPMSDKEVQTWDLLIPYVLFAIWETPQASTGFKLLFSHRPRGLLDVAKEA